MTEGISCGGETKRASEQREIEVGKEQKASEADTATKTGRTRQIVNGSSTMQSTRGERQHPVLSRTEREQRISWVFHTLHSTISLGTRGFFIHYILHLSRDCQNNGFHIVFSDTLHFPLGALHTCIGISKGFL